MNERPTHAADAAEPSDEWRTLVQWGADLCRRDPATFAASVRYSDHLALTGLDRFEARREALRRYDPQGEPRASG